MVTRTRLCQFTGILPTLFGKLRHFCYTLSITWKCSVLSSFPGLLTKNMQTLPTPLKSREFLTVNMSYEARWIVAPSWAPFWEPQSFQPISISIFACSLWVFILPWCSILLVKDAVLRTVYTHRTSVCLVAIHTAVSIQSVLTRAIVCPCVISTPVSSMVQTHSSTKFCDIFSQ